MCSDSKTASRLSEMEGDSEETVRYRGRRYKRSSAVPPRSRNSSRSSSSSGSSATGEVVQGINLARRSLFAVSQQTRSRVTIWHENVSATFNSVFIIISQVHAFVYSLVAMVAGEFVVLIYSEGIYFMSC